MGPRARKERLRPVSLIVEQIEVSRGGRTVLRDVSLSLRGGECACIVGPNGAGKSSLLMAMAGLLPTERGRVRVDERDVCSVSRRELARRVAYVPQSYEGYGGFSVSDVLASARFAHRSALEPTGPRDLERIAAEVAECGLTGLEQRTLSTLSAGERQKVWLAAALVQEAEYLLLDEPTSALDAKYLARIVALLQQQRRRGRGIVLVCHDLNIAAALECRVLALRGGCVAFEGPVAEFLRGPLLESVFETDFHLLDAEGGRRFVFPRC